MLSIDSKRTVLYIFHHLQLFILTNGLVKIYFKNRARIKKISRLEQYLQIERGENEIPKTKLEPYLC